jgi:hypothetical protein
MPPPRKRFTTQTSASRPRLTPLAPKHIKSIANPIEHPAPQLTENKSTSQKSIANFCPPPAFHNAFPTPHTPNPPPSQINRNSSGIYSPAFSRSVSHFPVLIETPPRIEIAITCSFKRRKHFLIETRNDICSGAPSGNADRLIRPARGTCLRPNCFTASPGTVAVDLASALPYACSLTTRQNVATRIRALPAGEEKRIT